MDFLTLKNVSANKLAFHALRLLFGISFFLHGVMRLPKLKQWAETIATEKFGDSIFAGFPALSMSYIIPFGETAAGLLLLMGTRFLKLGSLIGLLTMFTLLIGTGIIENHAAIPSQLLHALIFVLLLRWSTEESIVIR